LLRGKNADADPGNKDESPQKPRLQDSLVGRFGGDEFAVLLPGCPAKNIPNVVDRIISSVEEYNKNRDPQSPQISISIAGANMKQEKKISNSNVSGLIDIADKRMFEMKKTYWINCVREFIGDSLGQNVIQKVNLLKNILFNIDLSKITSIQNPQIAVLAICEFLKRKADENISNSLGLNDKSILEKAIKLRGGINEHLGIRDEGGKKPDFQKELDEIVFVFDEFIDSILVSKEDDQTPIQEAISEIIPMMNDQLPNSQTKESFMSSLKQLF
jgi:hypothetical protein